MKKILATAAVIGTMISTPAMAWGDKEQGILIGIIAGEIFGEIQENRRHRDTHRTYERVIVMPEHNPYNDRRKPGYSRGADDASLVCETIVRRHYNYVETVHENCYGETIKVERRPVHHKYRH